ncbi:MAG: hypothetical protein ACRD2W_20760, partial [Acidimicrobiales bacterium]
PTQVDAEPAVAALLAEAAGEDEEAAVRAARALQAVLDTGDVSEAQQHNLVSELCSLVLAAGSPRVRRALLDALAASSPFVGLSLVLELLLDHRDALDDDATATLLRALGRMLEVAEAADPTARGQVALLLRVEAPGPVLDALAASPVQAVATEAHAVRRRIDRLAPVLDE